VSIRPQLSPQEFEELFRRTAPEVQGYLLRRVGDDAQDLLSEVYLTAWRRRADLPGPEHLRAWLFNTARRLILAQAREAGRRRTAARLASVDAHPTPWDEQSDRLRRETIRAALSDLNDIDQELLTLTTWERLTPHEAAVVVGLRPGTARVRLHRARAQLARDPRVAAMLHEAAEVTEMAEVVGLVRSVPSR
jgi:RNA polymerase sigma-70 factor (ECF subfamily)